MTNPRTQRNQSSYRTTKEPDTKTFLEHIQELRNRLFWVVIVFLACSALSYPFFEPILAALVKPLGDQQLYYLTPVGGFSFIVKVCLYTGIVLTLPMIIYQLFRYIQPAISHVKGRLVVVYIVASFFLAVAGVLSAYFFSLPAALHFLTDFNMPQITALLTADSYFSFVMSYLIVAAILFQLPLVLLIFNSISPMGPGGLMKKQRYVVVIAFILGAILSPTPDILNQLLLAGPIILMYQVSIILVLIQNKIRRSRKNKRNRAAVVNALFTEQKDTPVLLTRQSAHTPQVKRPQIATGPTSPAKQQTLTMKKMMVSDIVPSTSCRSFQYPPSRSRPTVHPPPRPIMPRPSKRVGGPIRSLDGFAIE